VIFSQAGDWRAYFAGRWRMTRAIDDRLGGRRGDATGICAFRDGPRIAGLVCEEALVIDYGGNRFDGAQSTIWRFEESAGPDLDFQDGGFFCAARFEEFGGVWRAPLTHLCGDDQYDGDVIVASENSWRLIWRVKGPRKDYTLDTRYDRE